MQPRCCNSRATFLFLRHGHHVVRDAGRLSECRITNPGHRGRLMLNSNMSSLETVVHVRFAGHGDGIGSSLRHSPKAWRNDHRESW
jgi:hypothetical protein